MHSKGGGRKGRGVGLCKRIVHHDGSHGPQRNGDDSKDSRVFDWAAHVDPCSDDARCKDDVADCTGMRGISGGMRELTERVSLLIRTEDRSPVLKHQADKGGVRHTEPGCGNGGGVR